MPKPRPAHRPCLVCNHPDRALIERAKIAGAGTEDVAGRYRVSADAIYRHMRNHVTDEDRAQYIAEIPIADLAQKASESGAALLDYFSIIRQTLMNQFQFAASVGDRNAVNNTARALVEVLKEIGRLTGELLNASPITNINNTAIFLNSPVFSDLQAMLVRKLTPHPEALQAVLAGLEELEKVADQNETKLIELQPNGGGYVPAT